MEIKKVFETVAIIKAALAMFPFINHQQRNGYDNKNTGEEGWPNVGVMFISSKDE